MEYSFTSYYQLLKVEPTASSEEIKAAYKTAAKKYHPDQNGNSEVSNEYFLLIKKAYEVLLDPNKREMHDVLIGIKESKKEVVYKEVPKYIPAQKNDFNKGVILGLSIWGLWTLLKN